MTTPARIGFVLLSNSTCPMPSTRIAVLNMFPYLRVAGFDPRLVFEPERATETPELDGLAARIVAQEVDIVVFQKVHGASVERAAAELGAAGIQTIYSVCDLVDSAMAQATDATVVVTGFLKGLYPATLQHKVHVVHDGIESPELCKQDWSEHPGRRGDPLRALLVSSASLDVLPQIVAPPRWLEVEIVGAYPEQPRGPRLRTALRALADKRSAAERLAWLHFLTNRRIRCTPWSPEHVRHAMLAADIGIIPIDTSWPAPPGKPAPNWKVKSENRLTMKMAAGLPVIATPIPSYEEVIEHGVNGMFARSQRDWRTCLEQLRDPDLRRAMGARARATVIERYSMQSQAAALVLVLRTLLDTRRGSRAA